VNRTEHLLTILAEECAEVAQQASKALRFGLDDGAPGQELTNAQRIAGELDDLRAVAAMCQDEGLIPSPDGHRFAEKVAKVEHYLCYSSKRGTLRGHGKETG
jgi:hypothetical protein